MKTTLVVAAVLLLGEVVATATATSKVTSIIPNKGGRGGGVRLTIKGAGFSLDQYSYGEGNEDKGNKVTLVNSVDSQDSHECEIHLDGCTEVQIMCYTPTGMTIDAAYRVKVKVDNEDVPVCTTNPCLFTVKESYTATFDSISPRSGKPGDVILTMHGKIHTTRFGSNTPTSSNGVEERISRFYAPQICDLFESTDIVYQVQLDSTTSNSGTVQCKPEGTFVGYVIPAMLIEAPYGRTMTDMTLYRVSRKEIIYTVQYYTDAKSISPQEGSLLGGVDITITGDYYETAGSQSTYKPAEVYIGGEICTIVHVEKDKEIICTAPDQKDNQPSFYCGGRGMLVEWWDTTFESYSAALAKTKADNVDWYDETRYCGSITNKLTRMTGVFDVPWKGDYQFWIRADEGAKMFVTIDGTEIGIESTGTWAATGIKALEKGDLIKIVAVGKPGTKSDSCVEVMAHYKDTKFTPKDTKKAFSEIQTIRLTSQEENHNLTLKLSGLSSGTPTYEKQTLCVTGSNRAYQLELYTVRTVAISNVLSLSEVKTALDKLPLGITFTVEVDDGNDLCIVITIESKIGDVPLIKTKPTTDITVEETTPGLSNNLDLAFMYNDVPSPVFTYDLTDKTASAGKIKDALYGMFSVQCPTMYTTGGHFFESFEDVRSQVTAEVEPFCGRSSCKNCYYLFPISGRSETSIQMIYKWLCFAVRGHGSDVLYLKYQDKSDDTNIRHTWLNVASDNILEDGDWKYKCVDIKQEFESRWTTVSSGSFQLVQSRLSYNVDDFYLDTVYFGLKKSIGTLTDIEGLRLGQASPHPSMFATMNWVTVDYDEPNDQYVISMAPFDCLNKFNLLTLAGSDYSGGYTSSVSSVNSTLKTSSSPRGVAEVERTNRASKPIQGTITVGYMGKSSQAIDVTSDVENFKTLLEAIDGIDKLYVTKTKTATSECAGSDVRLEFTDSGGNKDKMTVTSALTSGFGAAAEIVEIRDGGLEIQPIPGDMICTHHTDPQVRVIINDVPTKCAMDNHECSFTYSSASTPTITDIDINQGNQNDVLTITGTLYSTDTSKNLVTIGDIPCDVTDSNSTHIVCTVGNGPLGPFPVVVIVVGKGKASGTETFTYTAAVSGIEPDTSTLGGHVVLTVSGKGLSEDSIVFFDSEECVEVDADIPTTIYCTVPAYTDLSATTDQTATVTVKTGNVSISPTFTFTYEPIDAEITSISGSDLTVHGGQTITIDGTDMGSDGKVFIDDTELNVTSRSDTQILAVTSVPTPPGKGLKLLVHYGTSGVILQSSKIPLEDVALDVTNVYPTKGSFYGGTRLTITGLGFGNSDADVKVVVGDYDCLDVDVTNTQIKCTIEDTATIHEVNNQGTQGRGAPYAFDPKVLSGVEQGDIIRWSWFTQDHITEVNHGVRETESLTAFEDKTDGMSSGLQSREGSHTERMTKLGTTFFWSGYVDSSNSIAYAMTVTVVERTAKKYPIRVHVAGQEALYDLDSSQSDPPNDSGCNIITSDIDGCELETVDDSDATKFNIFLTKCRSPVVTLTSFTPPEGSTVARSALTTTVIDFTGSGFSPDNCANLAKIGECLCAVTDSSTTSFECTPDASCSYGIGVYQLITLNVNQFGDALINIQRAVDRSVAFLPLIQSISPLKGSDQGGTEINITGTGFTDDLEKVSVSLGDFASVCTKAAQNSLICTTPYKPASVSAEVTVGVSIGAVPAVCESSCSFTYDSTITPSITSVSPTTLSSTTTLTIIGDRFGTDASKVTVKVGGQACSGVTMVTSNEKVTCSVDALPAGENRIELIVEDVGKASSTAEVNVTGEAVASVTPESGSIHGHTLLTFDGHGFVEGLTIQVGGKNICESVTVKSLTEVECVTVANEAEDTQLVITSNGVTYDGVDFEFSEAASPSVTSVNPSTGAVGVTVTIQGEKFGTLSSAIKVYIGDVECTDVDVDTDITCTTGAQASGAYDVVVDVSGKGRSQAGVTFTYRVTVTSFGPTPGDEEGNQLLKVIGNGFSDSHKVTMCDKECKVVSVPSSSEIRCITPAGTGTCQVKVTEGSVSVTAPGVYTYQGDLSPSVTKINPARGGTGGNTQVTITGVRFSDTESDISVTIDDVQCTVSASTTTEIVCSTGAHTGSKLSEVVVEVDGVRATPALTYHYVDVWSSSLTWGGDPRPGKGEAAVIPPNQVVLLDEDTEVLDMLVIQGEMVFDEKNLTLRAKRILITSGGKLQVGSEEKPFPADLKAIIELYGHHRDVELPIYGTKFLSVRKGELNLYGTVITNTWTRLAATAAVGAKSITLQDSISGWKIDDEIVVASTGPKDSTHQNEQRKITGISEQTKTIYFDEALEYEHLGNEEEYSWPNGTALTFEFRGEVGLLSRNIVVRGNSEEAFETEIEACEAGFDPGEFATQTCFGGRFGEEMGTSQFGAQIMIHASVKDTNEAVAHISYVEVTFAGQAFRLGRYPIHFHLNGDMSESFVRGCSIHKTFNRAVNIHGSHNTLIEKTVVYDVLGGAFFLEDGIETGNVFQSNLGVYVKASTSLLNDDITPATFWITNPNNTYRHNAAAGGTHFGFWFRMHEHPDGPSADDNICPREIPILEFEYNSAHSFGWFGLWMFAEYYPGADGKCNSVSAAPAVIRYFISWNNEKGLEFVVFGAMQCIGCVLVQNAFAGVEGKRTRNAPARHYLLSPTVNDTLIVGQAISEKNRNSKGSTKTGFIWPYGSQMQMHNVKFFNFDDSSRAMMYAKIDGTCSRNCGGYSNQVSGLQFPSTRYRLYSEWEHQGVIEDLDGSLSGTGQEQKIIPITGTGTSFPPDCATSSISEGYSFPGGLNAAVCPFEKRFHRFSFKNPIPSSLAGKVFKPINQYGSSESEFETHRLTHTDGWMVILVDGETYTFTFENSEEMTNASFTGTFEDFAEGDCIVFKMKLTQGPDLVSLDGGSTSFPESANSISCSTEGLVTGNWSYSEGYVSSAVVGLSSGSDTSIHSVHFKAMKCLFPNCEKPADPEASPPPDKRPTPFQLWEDEIWVSDSSGNLKTATNNDGESEPPTDGQDVTIDTGMWVVLKNSTYAKLRFGTLILKGTLEIDYEIDLAFELKANFIIILGGRLQAGWIDNPMVGTLNIILMGNKTSPLYTELDGYEIGNKAMAVFGGLELHGRDVGSPWARLKTTVSAGNTVLTVDDATKISNWEEDDEVIVTTSSNNLGETEEAVIQGIDGARITLKSELKNRHTGGVMTVEGQDINLSAVVGLKTRSIQVEGELVSGEAYGGRILSSVTLDGDNIRTGYVRVSNVLFTHMGQDGFTDYNDPRFALSYVDSGSVTNVKPSMVTKCAFVDLFSSAIGAIGLDDLEIRDNLIHKPLGNGIVTISDNTTVDGNLISHVQFTGVYGDRFEGENFRPEYGLEAIEATGITVENNIIAGSERFGYHVPGETCDSVTSGYSNNLAVACLYGVAIMPFDDLSRAGITTCTRLSGITVYKNVDYGVYYSNEKSLKVTGINFIEENVGLFSLIVGPDTLSHMCGGKAVEVTDCVVVGTSPLSNCAAETAPSGKYMRHNSGHLRSKRGPNSERLGLLFPSFSSGTNNCGEKPCWGIMAYNAICGKTTFTGITFVLFQGEQSGCKAAFAISTMKGNDDLAHPVRTSGIKKVNVDDEYIVLFHRPNVGLVNPADCVDMDCDAMKKAIVKDLDGTLMGEPGTVIPQSEWEWNGDPRRGLGDARVPKDLLTELDGNVMTVGEVATKGKGIVRTKDCVNTTVSNGDAGYHWCPECQHEMLLIESLDDDTETRRLSPVAVLSDGYLDLVNGPQDHGWCNGYTCQKRVSTFHVIVMIGTNVDRMVTVYFTSKQPDDIRFALLDAPGKCIIVGLYYLNPNRIDPYVDGKYVLSKNANKEKWTTSKQFVLENEPGVNYKPTCDDENGSNFIDRDARIIYFVVKGGTEISTAVTLKRAKVIIVTFGMPAMTVDEFFQDDKFLENLANLLNIPASKVRVAKVIAAGSTRKRRSADSGVEVTVEIGDTPTDTEDEDTEPVTDIAAELMNDCLKGTIGESLGVSGTQCEQLIHEETYYTPIQPDALFFVDSVTPQHEGVPFSVQPKIRANDTNGDIVDHLGLEESPWQITASLRSCDPVCGHANAELTGTLTVNSSNGWFNFTDLQISHKGDGYIIDFEVTSPTGTNMTLETKPFSVAGLPMTAGVYSMTSGDIPQDSVFTLTLDLRDGSTDEPIPDITWRGHASFDVQCDLVAYTDTGNFTGTLSTTFVSSSGRAAFNDLSFSGYGLIYISCLVVSDPVEYEFYSLHKVFVLGSHQADIVLEASNRLAVRYNLDYYTTLPTAVAEAQLEQVTVAVFTKKWPGIVIRESSISEGSIIVTFTIEGESYNVSQTTTDICDELSSGMTVTVGSTTLTLDGYLTVDGTDYYATCGKSDDESDVLHPALIALIVVLCLLVIGIVIFVLVWRFKIKPKSRTHGAKGDDSNNTNGLPGGFYYIDNGRTVFLAAPKEKNGEQVPGQGLTQTAGIAPMTTLFYERQGAFAMRKSPLPPDQVVVPRGLTPTGK